MKRTLLCLLIVMILSAFFIVSCDKEEDPPLTGETSSDTQQEESSSSGSNNNGEDEGPIDKVAEKDCPGHMYEVIEETLPTCTAQGYQLIGCKYCVKTYENAPRPLGHQMSEKKYTEATCGTEGYSMQTCLRDGCTFKSRVTTDPPTGKHTMSEEYQLLSAATYFTAGAEQKYCKNKKCNYTEPRVIPSLYDLSKLDIGANDINIGGIDYVNVSSCGISYATSIYRTTKTANAFDGDPTTYWMADTLVTGAEDPENNSVHDGERFTGDVLTYTLAKPFTVGQIRILVPNYYAWDIGVGVEYEVKVRQVPEEGEKTWVSLGTYGDADLADPKTENVYLIMDVDTTIQIDEIQFIVKKASRYAPAKINEVEIYAQTTNLQRVVKSIAPTASISVSGRWNDYFGGADALIDGAYTGGETAGWGTDYRTHRDAFHEVRFGETRNITSITFKADHLINERFSFKGLTKTDEGKDRWIELASYVFTADNEGEETITINMADEDWPGGSVAVEGLSIEIGRYGIQDDSEPTITEFTYDYTKEDSSTASETITEFEFDKTFARSYATFEWSSIQYLISLDLALTESGAIIYQLQYWDDANSKWEVYKFPILDTKDEDGDDDVTEIVRYVDCVPQIGKHGRMEYNFLIDSNGDEHIDTNDVGGLFTSKIRLELVQAYSHSPILVYEMIPSTIIEQTGEQVMVTGCKHSTYSPDEKKIVKPTCTTIGYTYFPCENCDEVAWISDSVDATGHTWVTMKNSSGQPLTETDANGNVSVKEKCSDCSAIRTSAISYASELGELKAPEVTNFLYNANGAWSMTFDDGNYAETYDWVTPVLERYDVNATIMFTISMGSGLQAQWRQYFAGGHWDLGSHSYTHKVVYQAKDEKGLMYEVNDAHYKLMSMFSGQRLLTFATPMGTTGSYAAEFYNDFMVAGRNGSEGDNYNKLDKLVERKDWGNMYSFTSKSNRHAGVYEFVKKTEVAVNFVLNPETNNIEDIMLSEEGYVGGTYIQTEYESIGVSGTKYQEAATTYNEDGTVKRQFNDFDDTRKVYEYRWSETGSYKKEGDKYVFVEDDSGEYVLVHTELGSYENGANQVVTNGYWVVECKHCIGMGPINHSYTSFLQQMEALTQANVWVGSYTQVAQYRREAITSYIDMKVEGSTIKFNLTDEMDDALFNHKLTVKLDIPDTWENITVMQNGVEIGIEEARDVFIETDAEGDKVAYISVVPDIGEVTVTQK